MHMDTCMYIKKCSSSTYLSFGEAKEYLNSRNMLRTAAILDEFQIFSVVLRFFFRSWAWRFFKQMKRQTVEDVLTMKIILYGNFWKKSTRKISRFTFTSFGNFLFRTFFPSNQRFYWRVNFTEIFWAWSLFVVLFSTLCFCMKNIPWNQSNHY